MRIAIAGDHGGYEMKEDLKVYLKELGHSVVDLGPADTQPVDYPDFAVQVGVAVAAGLVDRGIMVDGAGIGSCMVANKVPGCRAAMCYDLSTANNAREHNDANVLTLGGGLVGKSLARQIAKTFIDTPFAGGRHSRRVDKIKAMDGGATP
ncbi:MAG TPA: ribose 5-phosphate isomerase B [Symbiobacteriaceae bacterium]|jgi:ribose 5-phosphate isomerase B